ncbi:MAG: hypothetical protein QM820_64570 [Minicystis sp.]
MTTNLLTGAGMTYWQGRKCTKKREYSESLKREKETVLEAKFGEALKPALSKAGAETMFAAACNVIDVCSSMRKSTKSQALARTWFGFKVDLEEVYGGVDTLIQHLTKKGLLVRFARDKMGSLGAYDPDFWIPGVAQLGKPILYKRYTWGEKVMTFLHEMSHAILGTVDKGADPEYSSRFSLGAVYGPDALKLASGKLSHPFNGPTEAIKNAENWGYFLVNHHVFIDDKRDDLLGYPDEFTRISAEEEYMQKMETYIDGRPDMPPSEFDHSPYHDTDLFDTRITDAPEVKFVIKEKMVQVPTLTCQVCNKSGFSKLLLGQHMKNVHNLG